jgi:hypothetical protein
MTLLLILLLSLVSRPHPFFVSVTEIEYIEKDRMLGISTKIFYDDLEKTLKNFSGREVDIVNGDRKQNLAQITAYFARHFTLRGGTSALPYKVIGYEIEADAAFVYMEAPVTELPARLTVNTDLLYDLDRSQINMLHFVVNGKRQSHRLNYPNREVAFEPR